MTNKIIGIIIALLVIALVGFYMYDQRSEDVAGDTHESSGEMMEGDKDAMMEDDQEEAMEGEAMHEGESTYLLSLADSSLQWSASRIVGTPHTGSVGLVSGSLNRTDGTFTGGEFVIDMEAITEVGNNERFLGHIASEDFFAVETYPTSRFVATRIDKTADGSYSVTGDLTILDQTHEITFPASLQETADMLVVDAQFEIDRTRWGITYDSGTVFQQLGDKAIEDTIDYTLHLEFSSVAEVVDAAV